MASAQSVDLSGSWEFALGEEPDYDGERVELPGSMLTNGRGREVSVETVWTGSLYDSSFFFREDMAAYRVEGRVKLPFFLTPEREYVGRAWYGRTVDIPASWRGRRVFVYLERAHIETELRVNGRVAGRDSSLSVPHVFDITPLVCFGESNRLDVGVRNEVDSVGVGEDSHSVSDQTQGNWNGIVGRMELVARPERHIRRVEVYPCLSRGGIDVCVWLRGLKAGERARLRLCVDDEEEEVRTVRVDEEGCARLSLDLRGEVRLWDEWTPNLYGLSVVWGEDSVRTTFGMREISCEGRQLVLNGRPIWLRGTVESCCFPLTGYPPTDVGSWRAIFEKCKSFGLNHMRFHSYCPPEAAFAAADSVGFYLQVEGPTWPNHGVKLGVGMRIDDYLMAETRRMVECYGNHPSFVMLAAGNEPAGEWVEWTQECFLDYWLRTDDHRRLYTSASVGGGWAFTPRSEYHVRGGARGLTWGKRMPQSTDDFEEAVSTHVERGRTSTRTFVVDRPFIGHETGQWCAFPDLKEVSQYTGVYRAGNFDIFADLLERGGMADRAERFLMASGRLQTLAYKFDIERNLRTADYAGFQLLGLNDYSGQGSALVGVLNVFWREKGYCRADDWRAFCSAVVPLARFDRFVFVDSDTLRIPVELYNAYHSTLTDARPHYSISTDEGRTLGSEVWEAREIAPGKNIQLGEVVFRPGAVEKPMKLRLTVGIDTPGAPELRAANGWDFWIYPSQVEMPSAEGIYLTDTLDERARGVLADGGRVLLAAAGKVRMGSDIKQTYLPVFWNTSWFKMRPPHTTGVCIDRTHPLFDGFPTDDWGNLNWWELVNNAQVMYLGHLPADYQSPIQPIDTYHLSRKLGMLVEARVGEGRLLMTTMDIDNDLQHRVVARQMRKALIDYMRSERFNPSLELDLQTVEDWFEKDAPRVELYTGDSPDELKPTIK